MRNKLTAACITIQFQFGEYWIIIFMTLSCRVVDGVRQKGDFAHFLAQSCIIGALEVQRSDYPIDYALIVVLFASFLFVFENESQETHLHLFLFFRKKFSRKREKEKTHKDS